MKIKRGTQYSHGALTLTADNITAEQIREARDRWPDKISSDRAANALGLPWAHTDGGLPIFWDLSDMWDARFFIADLINKHWRDPSSEHTTEIVDP